MKTTNQTKKKRNPKPPLTINSMQKKMCLGHLKWDVPLFKYEKSDLKYKDDFPIYLSMVDLKHSVNFTDLL